MRKGGKEGGEMGDGQFEEKRLKMKEMLKYKKKGAKECKVRRGEVTKEGRKEGCR